MIVLDFDNVLFYNNNEPFTSCASFLVKSTLDTKALFCKYIDEKYAISNLKSLYNFFSLNGALPDDLLFSSFKEQLWEYRKKNSNSEDYIKLFVATKFFDELLKLSINQSMFLVVTSRDSLTVSNILAHNNFLAGKIISSTEIRASKAQIINQHKSYVYIDDMYDNFKLLKYSERTQLIWAKWGNLHEAKVDKSDQPGFITSETCDHTIECLKKYLNQYPFFE